MNSPLTSANPREATDRPEWSQPFLNKNRAALHLLLKLRVLSEGGLVVSGFGSLAWEACGSSGEATCRQTAGRICFP